MDGGSISKGSQIAVIGAGIAGLSASRELSRHGYEVVVLDKGRGPGGRASRRCRSAFAWDHGAQYFTARDPCFSREIETWREAGAIARWTPRLVAIGADGVSKSGGGHERWVGVPGMNALAKYLAQGLDLRCSTRADRVIRSGSTWRVLDKSGAELARSEALIVTAPPMQALPFLAASPRLEVAVARAAMRPCWAVLLGFTQPVPVDYDAAFVNVGSLAWVARNSSKPDRDGGESWVLHASTNWSELNLEDSPEKVSARLIEEFSKLCVGSELPPIAHRDAHRWRYAQPDPGLTEPFLLDKSLCLGVAGDWCGASRIEGAFLSGLALSLRIRECLCAPGDNREMIP